MTPTGEALLPHARRMLALASEVVTQLARVSTDVSATLVRVQESAEVIALERAARRGPAAMREARELVGATLLLASDGAGSFITGAEVVIDGGLWGMAI